LEGRQVTIVDVSFSKLTSSNDLSLDLGTEGRELARSSSNICNLGGGKLHLARELMVG
jgi:hypothetical protein